LYSSQCTFRLTLSGTIPPSSGGRLRAPATHRLQAFSLMAVPGEGLPAVENARFWRCLDTLVETCELIIDRPCGSTHPRYPAVTYPLDYGYLAGTTAADGGGIDVWVGTLPVKMLSAVMLTIDLLKRDGEMKVLLGCTHEEMALLLRFHNDGSQMAMLVER